MSEISFATVNTLFCKAFQDMETLSHVLTADVVVLQEVIDLPTRSVEMILADAGYHVVATAETCGLLIASRTGSPLQVVPASEGTYIFGPLSYFEKLLVRMLVRRPHQFTERGMLYAKFSTGSGTTLTVVNAHPGISFASRGIRRRQIRKINQQLKNEMYAGSIIVAGDMNHRPGPEHIDLQLRKEHELQAVDLAGQQTWIAKGSDFEWFVRIAMAFNRRSLASYDAQMDVILCRGDIEPIGTAQVLPINSDHRAVLARFQI